MNRFWCPIFLYDNAFKTLTLISCFQRLTITLRYYWSCIYIFFFFYIWDYLGCNWSIYTAPANHQLITHSSSTARYNTVSQYSCNGYCEGSPDQSSPSNFTLFMKEVDKRQRAWTSHLVRVPAVARDGNTCTALVLREEQSSIAAEECRRDRPHQNVRPWKISWEGNLGEQLGKTKGWQLTVNYEQLTIDSMKEKMPQLCCRNSCY